MHTRGEKVCRVCTSKRASSSRDTFFLADPSAFLILILIIQKTEANACVVKCNSSRVTIRVQGRVGLCYVSRQRGDEVSGFTEVRHGYVNAVGWWRDVCTKTALIGGSDRRKNVLLWSQNCFRTRARKSMIQNVVSVVVAK